MTRKTAIVFIAITLLFSSCIPSVSETSTNTTAAATAPVDYYSDVPGNWASSQKQLYLMHGLTVTFSDDLTDTDKRMWLLYLDEAFSMLPVHTQGDMQGLLYSFNSGNTCVEDNYLACFTRHNFSVFMSTTKQLKKRDNLKTILHEIGHAVDYKLSGNKPSFSDSLHKNKNKPTNYAETNAYEDFADSFAVYVLSPGYLNVCCNERYEFMKDKVFLGREYFNK